MRDSLQIIIIVVVVIVAVLAIPVFYGPRSTARLKARAEEYAKAVRFGDHKTLYDLLAKSRRHGYRPYINYVNSVWRWNTRKYHRVRVIEVKRTDRNHGTVKITYDYTEYGRSSSDDFTSYWVYTNGNWYRVEPDY